MIFGALLIMTAAGALIAWIVRKAGPVSLPVSNVIGCLTAAVVWSGLYARSAGVPFSNAASLYVPAAIVACILLYLIGMRRKSDAD